jgi:hexosaminidase
MIRINIIAVFVFLGWVAQAQIIPMPIKQYVPIKDQLELIDGQWSIWTEKQFLNEAEILAQQIRIHRDFHPKVNIWNGKDEVKGVLLSKAKSMMTTEAYKLEIDKYNGKVTATSPEGLLHGVFTLVQMTPLKKGLEDIGFSLDAWVIEDEPHFKHRGLLLDCGRHFMSVDKIKETLSTMALYKLNVFHWHLTEDQGWRIEIKKYPELTKVGAYRKVNGQSYGGYYMQDEIREIVQFANKLHIMVIPEIELPGHSVAAIASYPWLSCTGKQIPVETEWGVFKDIYCAGNDQTLQFLKDVMDEVSALFPGPYIHIGGDEAPKVRWEHCDKCQKRIKDQHLKNEAELQTWLIEQMASYLKTKGKDVIGWDEILEGGIPSGAVIQSWRGIQGGFDAAMHNHSVVMSPTSHCYLDYGLDGIDTKKVYEFDPIPADLPVDKQAYILGAEGNMWTERAPEAEVTSKIFPRLIALSEVLWTYPKERDALEFQNRLKRHFPMLDKRKVKYGFMTTPVQFVSGIDGEVLWVDVQKQQEDLTLFYTTTLFDSNSIDEVKEVLEINEPIEIRRGEKVNLKVGMKSQGSEQTKWETKIYANHLALGKEIELNYTPSNAYLGGGSKGLVNGCLGSDNFRDGHWQAAQGRDMEMIIDLGKVESISELTTRWFHYANAWIFRPESVSYYTSIDKNNWQLLKTDEVGKRTPANESGEFPVFSKVLAEDTTPYGFFMGRYIKVSAKSIGKCPDWHDAPGEHSWLFIDEVIVR